MRWILVFIFFYLIPLIVLFKNYKKFSRACIYACTYVVLATTIVISNMYISGIKQIENSENHSMVMNYRDIYTSNLDVNHVEEDLSTIKQYKKDIRSIEDIALNPIKECVAYATDIKTSLNDIDKVKDDIEKAKYMCDRVVEIYDDMDTPELSQQEYTEVLNECTECMKDAYKLKYKAVEETYNVVNNKDITSISNIQKYIKQSNEKINQYKKKINELEESIKNE